MEWLRPQKPHDYDPEKKAHRDVMVDNSPWLAEEKFDGWRVNVTRDMVYSSAGKILTIPWLLGKVEKGDMVDGEVLGEDTEVSTDVATLIAHFPEQLIWRPFDVIYRHGEFFGGEKLTNRRNYLDGLFHDGYFADQRIRISEQYHKGKKELLERLFNNGKEGIVLKHRDSQWKSGSRVGWIRVKQTYNMDVVIVDAKAPCAEWTVEPGKVGRDGILYPQGKRSKSWLKGYVCVHYGMYDKKGNLRIVGSLGESGPPEVMEKWVGTVVEIKGYGKEPLPTGASRHPQFIRHRPDKLPEDCVFDFKDSL